MLGPVATVLLLIGWLLYAAVVALAVALIVLVVAAGWGISWLREERRRQVVATPRPAAGVEPWARGHREVSAAERAIMAPGR